MDPGLSLREVVVEGQHADRVPVTSGQGCGQVPVLGLVLILKYNFVST